MLEFTRRSTRHDEARFYRMVEHAKALGGNAVVGIRFDSNSFADAYAEFVAYGSAVIVKAA